MKDYNKDNIPLAKALRKNMTPWETKLWYQFLSKYPIRFQRQKIIDQYIVDFFCAKAGVIVELDGGGHYDPLQTEKDKIRTSRLEEYGYCVLRFCNLEVDKNFYEVCTVIDDAVKSKIPPSLREVAERM